MSNQPSSTVTPSLNSPPPAPPTTPTSIADNVSNFFSNAESAVSAATDSVTNAATQATERVSDVTNDVVSSLTGTEEPVTLEPVINPPSDDTFANQSSQETLANIPSSQETKRKRCRNGTRKDKIGDCQPKQPKQTKHRKSAVKSHHMTAKYHELKLENNILIKQQKKAINLTKKLMNFLTLQ
jgi:hypothetical protein